MPYLDYSGITYTPNQMIINWSNFRWTAVDLLIMEDDESINYLDLVRLAVPVILAAAGASGYAPMADKVLAALKGSWFTDDDDYVDTVYQVVKGWSGVRTGAGGNAQLTLGAGII